MHQFMNQAMEEHFLRGGWEHKQARNIKASSTWSKNPNTKKNTNGDANGRLGSGRYHTVTSDDSSAVDEGSRDEALEGGDAWRQHEPMYVSGQDQVRRRAWEEDRGEPQRGMPLVRDVAKHGDDALAAKNRAGKAQQHRNNNYAMDGTHITNQGEIYKTKGQSQRASRSQDVNAYMSQDSDPEFAAYHGVGARSNFTREHQDQDQDQGKPRGMHKGRAKGTHSTIPTGTRVGDHNRYANGDAGYNSTYDQANANSVERHRHADAHSKDHAWHKDMLSRLRPGDEQIHYDDTMMQYLQSDFEKRVSQVLAQCRNVGVTKLICMSI
jgi:hypothetical protein